MCPALPVAVHPFAGRRVQRRTGSQNRGGSLLNVTDLQAEMGVSDSLIRVRIFRDAAVEELNKLSLSDIHIDNPGSACQRMVHREGFFEAENLFIKGDCGFHILNGVCGMRDSFDDLSHISLPPGYFLKLSSSSIRHFGESCTSR